MGSQALIKHNPGFFFLHVSDSESASLYDWRLTANQFILALSLLKIATRDIFATEPLR
jgi:hypothetical protein